MKIQSINQGKIVTISGSKKNNTGLYKILFSLSVFITGLLIFSYIDRQFLYQFYDMLYIILFTLIFHIILYHILNKAAKTEKLLITKTTIGIEKKSLFHSSENKYELNNISNFRYVEEPKATDHPLAGKTIDYFGFQKKQEIINVIHSNDRLAFDYNGNIISFGQNIYSWHFEEIQQILLEITGKDFANETDLLSSINTNV